ncbi:hypothetical protein D9M68_800140 [compost metagenome]
MGVDAHVGPGGVHAGALAAFVAEAVADGVLDLQCREVEAGQRAVLRRDLNLDGLLRREPDFPGDLAGRVVQVLLAAVAAVPQLHQYPLRESAVQIQAHGVAPRGLDAHTTACLEGQWFVGDALHLIGQHVLHASGAGEEKFELVHGMY